jgi:hypothetical protein
MLMVRVKWWLKGDSLRWIGLKSSTESLAELTLNHQLWLLLLFQVCKRASERDARILTHISFNLCDPRDLLEAAFDNPIWMERTVRASLVEYSACLLIGWFWVSSQGTEQLKGYLSLLIEFRNLSRWTSKLFENVIIFNIILETCISDVGYHILRKH